MGFRYIGEYMVGEFVAGDKKCSARAHSFCFGTTIDESWEYMVKEMGAGVGHDPTEYWKSYPSSIGAKEVLVFDKRYAPYGEHLLQGGKCPTVNQFCNGIGLKGTWIVGTVGHVLPIMDGNYFDTGSRPRALVRVAYRIR